MRLINVDTLELRTFGDDDTPAYAILSHKWAAEELSYQDFQNPRRHSGPSFEKIASFCRLIRSSPREDKELYVRGKPKRLDWCWIDTVCIDKSSSVELSEAINSMWKYYRHSVYCVAYLADVERGSSRVEIGKSQWFTRGWTLQELLAPKYVIFYDEAWDRLGDKDERSRISKIIAEASGVPLSYLNLLLPLSHASVAQRMSWAAMRRTTRREDHAYCLMGLFDVNMPLLYGEGEKNAFKRLQTTIISQSDDESIFVFKGAGNLLADSPRAFLGSGHVRQASRVERSPYEMTHKGLRIKGPAIRLEVPWHDCFLLKLNCVQGLFEQKWNSQDEAFRTSTSQGCVLGLKRIGDQVCRVPGLEQAATAWTSDEVEQKVEERRWERVERIGFVVSLHAIESTMTVVPSGADPAMSVASTSSDHIRCVDGEGPYYLGIGKEHQHRAYGY